MKTPIPIHEENEWDPGMYPYDPEAEEDLRMIEAGERTPLLHTLFVIVIAAGLIGLTLLVLL